MLDFFRRVEEAVVEKDVRGLADMVACKIFAYDEAESAFRKYKYRRNGAAIRTIVQSLATFSFDDAESTAVQAARKVAKTGDVLYPELETFLSWIPRAVRQSLIRTGDPLGRTNPPSFALRTPVRWVLVGSWLSRK